MNQSTNHHGLFRCGLSSQGKFRFVLTDFTSKGTLVTVTIHPGDLALAMTGRADLPCEFVVNQAAVGNTGKRRIDRTIGIDHAEASDRAREFQYLKYDHPHKAALVTNFRKWALDAAIGKLTGDDQRIPFADWRLANDGIGRKQETGSWHVTICRFQEIEKES